ncbi:MAG: RAMP superfamily CRISPR-associated protein [Fibromonadaceae bacterium]|jgi:CRISPR-associated protein Csm5|nr:RAMP superfamily CRISPR-associated protein [Fibromonadaceae bacterium]
MKELQKLFQSKCTKEDIDYKSKITKHFLNKYEENSKKDPLQNAAKILEMYRSKNDFVPIIPGSSIKGAIRTAVLDEKGKNKENKEDNELFRSLAIADCTFSSESTIVGAMQMLNKYGEKKADMQILADVILGSCIGDRNFSGEIDLMIYEKLQKCLSIDLIRKKCNEFYLREFDKEYEKFYKKKENEEQYKVIKWLKKELDGIEKKEDSFVIRLGRWSQVEFVTFQDRKPLTRRGKDGKPLPHGTTRTVFMYSGYFVPMGWCVCKFNTQL